MGRKGSFLDDWLSRVSTGLNLTIFFAALISVVVLALRFQEEVACLELNIHFEAAREPKRSKEAIAFVTIARALSAKGTEPRTPCTVTYANRAFSWTIGRAEDAPKPNISADIQLIARRFATLWALSDLDTAAQHVQLPKDALFYKRFDWDDTKMSPRVAWEWANCREPILDAQGNHVRIGAHVFYRDKPGPCTIPRDIPVRNGPTMPQAPASKEVAPTPPTKKEGAPVPPIKRVQPKQP